LNVIDFEPLARAAMDPAAFDYYAGGAEDELTLAENRRAFERWGLVPRVLVNVERVDTSTSLLGLRLPFPIALAPTAFNKLGHSEGELAAARAAGAAGTLMCCSTISSTTLEDTSAAATGPLWFQLYVYRDREVTRDLVARAEAAGFRALVVTVDTPRLGRRERDLRNVFTLPPDVNIVNLQRYHSTNAAGLSHAPGFREYVHTLLDSSLTWDAIEWISSLTRLPVLVKGVIAPADAEHAVLHGASGVVVSNHGGRQLDGVIASIDALPPVVERVSGRVPVVVDGGIRRGTDVFKALALGASAVLIGRPYLWGLAAAGQEGVARVLEMLQAELELTMALSGCPSVSAIRVDHVQRRLS